MERFNSVSARRFDVHQCYPQVFIHLAHIYLNVWWINLEDFFASRTLGSVTVTL